MKLTSFKDVHITVKTNFYGRLAIHTAELILVCSVLAHHRASLSYWMIWFVIFLVWPSLAYFIASSSADQIKTEKNLILFEAVLVGACFGILKFDLWACLAISSINLLFNTMIGGPKIFFKSIGVMAVSSLLTITLIPDFHSIFHSSTVTMIISIILVLIAIGVMGIFAHITNKRLSKHRRELKEKQEQITSSLK